MSADYGYFSGDSTPPFVAKDTRTGMTFAAAVSMEGGGDPLHACLQNGSMVLGARKSLSEQTESPASLSLSVVFESSVWTRSAFQVTLQPMGLPRDPS